MSLIREAAESVAINQATAIDASVHSTITVTTNGTINSGSNLNIGGGTPSGISAGYSSGASDLNVTGDVFVNNNAIITALAGRGIDAFNFGNGNVTVSDSAQTTGAQFGIAASQQGGSNSSGNITVSIALGAIVTGNTGVFAQLTGSGAIGITNYGTITGVTGQAIGLNLPAGDSATINNYGTINGNIAPINGTTTIYNYAGAAWNAGFIGDNGLIIASGAASTVTAATGINLATTTGSTGALTAIGSNVTVTGSSNGVIVGFNGAGNLTVEAGATVTSDFLTIAQNVGSQGTVLVEGLGTTVNATTGQFQSISVGSDGTASLTIADQSMVTATNLTVALNFDTGVTDTVDVNDATLNVSANVTIGNSGSAAVKLENGATVNVGSLNIAYNTGSTGTLTVLGSHVTITDPSNGAVVGFNGVGNLTVEAGATFTSDFLNIAQNVGSQGTVLVEGLGTTLTTTTGQFQDILVGSDGTASLTIADQSTVTATNLIVAENFDTGVTDTVDVNAATLNVSNFVTLGNSGTAAVRFENGATVNAVGFSIANNIGSAGTLTVTGAGTVVTTSAISFGAGSGKLIVLDGGILDVTGSITGTGSVAIATGGTLELAGSAAQGVTFEGAGGMLKLDNPSSFTGQISGLVIGDIIDLTNTTVKNAAINGSTLTVTKSNNQTLTYQIAGSLSGKAFAIQSDNAGGDELVLTDASPNFWGNVYFPSQLTQGVHLFSGKVAANPFTGTAALFYGSTGPTPSYDPVNDPTGPYSITRSVLPLDPFFLPTFAGSQVVIPATLLTLPARNNFILPSINTANGIESEGIAFFETQDGTGNNVLDRVIGTGNSGDDYSPLAISSPIQIENAGSNSIYNLDASRRQDNGTAPASYLSTYSVAWDQYDPLTQTFGLRFQIFNADGSQSSGVTTPVITNSNGTSLTASATPSSHGATTLPAWSFGAGGGIYALAIGEHNSSTNRDFIQFQGYNTDGSPNTTNSAQLESFQVQPNITFYTNTTASATNHITQDVIPSLSPFPGNPGQQLQFAQVSANNANDWVIGWNETVTDSNGNFLGDQVEFVVDQAWFRRYLSVYGPAY